jgi:hypothetical protein
MITVVDHVSPWLMPSNTLARITQPHEGAHINSNGTGSPINHPATSTGFRPTRSDTVPAKKLVAALTAPNATMKVSTDVNAASPKTFLASNGRTVRSWPIMPPTSALTATSNTNCGRFSRSPNRMGGLGGVWSVMLRL